MCTRPILQDSNDMTGGSMHDRARAIMAPVFAVALTLAIIGVVQAQEQPKSPFSMTTELTGVWTAGNSQSNTFGLDLKLQYALPKVTFKIEGGGVRASATKTTRYAVGPDSSNYTLGETKVTEKTAEAYYARGRGDYNFSDGLYAFGGADWLRNTFSGIDSRTLIALGAGNIWSNTDQVKFQTDVAVTYTFQQDVVSNPFLKSSFPGVRFQYDLKWQIVTSTEFSSVLVGDWAFSKESGAVADGADIRADLTNAFTIAISSKLALKPSLQLLWRNAPALTEIDLIPAVGQPATGTVIVPLQKTDSFFKLALVVKF
jgi:putative salt-induced outer membrane protein YdiY